MRLSIAMCTYNGQKYLKDQLKSIASQSRLPDEMVICDDVSTDNTMEILTAFASESPFPVNVYRNEHNLGSTQNFDKATSLCSGDIIFFADQDDVWLPEKLANFEETFNAHPEAGIVYSDASIVDANLAPLGFYMSQTFGMTDELRHELSSSHAFRYLMRRNYITGATMAFRSRYRWLISPISPHWVHDHWIATLIATQTYIVPIPETLILYRQHDNNQIGLTHQQPLHKRAIRGLKIPPEAYKKASEKMEDLQHRLCQHNIKLSDEDNRFLSEKIAHNYVRATLPKAKLSRLQIVIAEAAKGRYSLYSPNGMLSALRDLLA